MKAPLPVKCYRIQMEPTFDLRRASSPTRVVVTPIIIAINTIVFLLWQVALRSPELLRFFELNFVVSGNRLSHGMAWTLLTAAFSHYMWWHFAFNMIAAWSFGVALERLLGWRIYLSFYLGAAVISSLSHCILSSLLERGDVGALGASGAVSGVLLLFALLFPDVRILLFGVIPIPALIGVLGFIGLDIWGLIAQSQGGGLPIGHGAHLGGALCGGLMYFMYVRARLVPLERSYQNHRNGDQPLSSLSKEEAAEFDRLRLKLTTMGSQSLTPKEKDFLLEIRQRVLSGN